MSKLPLFLINVPTPESFDSIKPFFIVTFFSLATTRPEVLRITVFPLRSNSMSLPISNPSSSMSFRRTISFTLASFYSNIQVV